MTRVIIEERASTHVYRQKRMFTKEELDAREGRFTLKSLAVNGSDLMELGLRGKQIGDCLNRLLEQVLSGTLPNEKAALLQAAKTQE